MDMIYPAVLEPDEGSVMLTFPDFPEAFTSAPSEDQALAQASDCLEEAIASRIADREEIPPPRTPKGQERAVYLPTLTAAKALLWMELRRRNLKKADLARLAGWDQKQVDRLFDFKHSSKGEVIDQAFSALGKRLTLSLMDAA